MAKSERIIVEAELTGLIFGIETDKEIWGGVGIQAIAWSPHEENILAAVTLKTNRLEIWNVEKGAMVAIYDLRAAFFEIKWGPHDPNLLIAREINAQSLFKIDISTGKQIKIPNAGVSITSMEWHPRRPNFVFLGNNMGYISLFNIDEMFQEKYFTIDSKDALIPDDVIDIVYSPGEDVFLAVRRDGALFLFGVQEN